MATSNAGLLFCFPSSSSSEDNALRPVHTNNTITVITCIDFCLGAYVFIQYCGELEAEVSVDATPVCAEDTVG